MCTRIYNHYKGKFTILIKIWLNKYAVIKRWYSKKEPLPDGKENGFLNLHSKQFLAFVWRDKINT
jgi:hypothetical protein